MKWYPLLEDDLPKKEQEMKRLSVRGKRLCIVRHHDQYYATSSRCPHAGADLTQGWCEQGKIVCPYHRHAFDVTTGRGDPGQGNYIHTYPLQQDENGNWFIGFKESLFRKLFY